MAEDWISIAEIAKRLNVAENTARRYTHLFSEFLKERKFGRTTKYTLDAIEVISQISVLYSQGLTTEEIKRKLHNEFPQIVEIDEEERQLSISSASSYEMLKQIMADQVEQKNFNILLLEKLAEQQQYIEQSIEKRDAELTQTLRLLAAAREEKKESSSFWSKLFSRK